MAFLSRASTNLVMIETVDSDPPLNSILLQTTSHYPLPAPLEGRTLTDLDRDVGQPAVLDLLVISVVVEVAPVLPVSVTPVAVLELHACLLLSQSSEVSADLWNCRTLLTRLPSLVRPASAARLVLTLRAESTLALSTYWGLSTF